uniref:Uncharacterized protein n=1 Tax=Erpetoichthys calabaricus TaxID=27687 RepID=A0A8C4SJE2_ERPCA
PVTPSKWPLASLVASLPSFLLALPSSLEDPQMVLVLIFDPATLFQLQYQGSPFSDPGFSAPDLQLAALPTAAIGFLAWRSMAVEERLSSNVKAYSVYIEFLQLVMDDQSQLNPAAKDLKDALEHHHTHLQGLKSNISNIMTNMGFQVPVVADTISSICFNVSEFQRKIRGYVFCKDLKLWIDRTVRDFQLLMTTFSTA